MTADTTFSSTSSSPRLPVSESRTGRAQAEVGVGGDNDDPEPVIPVSASHLSSCGFTSWFPLFRRHTIASRIIPLPEAFIQYLLEDGINIPDALQPARCRGEDSDDDWEQEEGEDENAEGAGAFPTASSSSSASFFPSLLSSMEAAIAELGGFVYPRMDWLSPSDAVWISADKTLRCNSAADILLLLKASDRIAASLSSPSSSLSSRHLILRRWSNLFPSSLFRCFLHHHSLLAISQRDATYYDHLTLPSHRRRTVRLIRQWVERVVLPVWTEEEGRGVLDVYVDGEGRVWLVEVKVWGGETDPALFSWRELQDLADEKKSEVEAEAGEDEDGHDEEEEDESRIYYRVVESGGDSRYMLRVANKAVRRLPAVDGIDLSDARGIDRFVAAVQQLQ